MHHINKLITPNKRECQPDKIVRIKLLMHVWPHGQVTHTEHISVTHIENGSGIHNSKVQIAPVKVQVHLFIKSCNGSRCCHSYFTGNVEAYFHFRVIIFKTRVITVFEQHYYSQNTLPRKKIIPWTRATWIVAHRLHCLFVNVRCGRVFFRHQCASFKCHVQVASKESFFCLIDFFLLGILLVLLQPRSIVIGKTGFLDVDSPLSVFLLHKSSRKKHQAN